MLFNLAILIAISLCPCLASKEKDKTFSCRTYGQENYVFLRFSSFNYTFERFRALLDYYANGLMLTCDNASSVMITSYLLPVFGMECRCSGNIFEHGRCVMEFANNTMNYINSIVNNMTGGGDYRLKSYDNGGSLPAVLVNWPVILTRGSDRLRADSLQMYPNLAMARLMLLTDMTNDSELDQGLVTWMRTDINALGAFPLNDEENLSYFVIIYDGNLVADYRFPSMAGLNRVQLDVNLMLAYDKNATMRNSTSYIQPFCKPATMWTSSAVTDTKSNTKSNFTVAVFVSLSNSTTNEEESAVHQYISKLQSQLPGDMCPDKAVMDRLPANRSMTDYFKVIVYTPEMQAISCPLLQSNFTDPFCSNCLKENFFQPDRLESLRSTTFVNQLDCILGDGIIDQFVQLLMALENDQAHVTILYITNLIPSCINSQFLAMSSDERRRIDLDIWFLNTTFSTVDNHELALFDTIFDLHGNENNSVRFTFVPNPIRNLLEPHWTDQTAICQRNLSSGSLRSTTPYVPTPEPHWDKPNLTWLYYAIGGLFIVLLVIVVCLFRFYRRRQFIAHLEQMAALEQHKHTDYNGVSNMYCKLKQAGRIDSNRLHIVYDQQLGHGAFASVYRGKLYEHIPNGDEKTISLEVAVKLPTAKKLVEVGQIEHELEILSQISQHPNIITLHGFIEDKDTFGLVLELASDNLLEFAKSTTVENFSLRFTFTVARQIASAMQHLVAANLVHRDLAARNILLTASRTAKLSDFGLCCRSNDDSLYYMAMSNRRLPVKWMALEIFNESGQRFSEKSDIWSFGVLLYEVFSLGTTPYENLPNEVLREFLLDGKRLDRQDLIPEKIYELMLQCWNAEPLNRPTFAELYNTFDGLLNDQLENYDYMTVGNAH